MSESTPYNPLDRQNLGASVAEALLERPVHPLGERLDVIGAGIYVIYYTGAFNAYESLACRNAGGKFEAPIYVGKAIPEGARKGKFGLGLSLGQALQKRLREHANSIQQASNLEIGDFFCRYLMVEDVWIPLGEALLIAKFSPVWNHLIDGFGNHKPGKGREEQRRSRWDTLHPGRAWALSLPDRSENPEQIAVEIKNHLSNVQIPPRPAFHVAEGESIYLVQAASESGDEDDNDETTEPRG